MLSVEDALARILAVVRVLEAERIPLSRARPHHPEDCDHLPAGAEAAVLLLPRVV